VALAYTPTDIHPIDTADLVPSPAAFAGPPFAPAARRADALVVKTARSCDHASPGAGIGANNHASSARMNND
jgi:hypothetical protein